MQDTYRSAGFCLKPAPETTSAWFHTLIIAETQACVRSNSKSEIDSIIRFMEAVVERKHEATTLNLQRTYWIHQLRLLLYDNVTYFQPGDAQLHMLWFADRCRTLRLASSLQTAQSVRTNATNFIMAWRTLTASQVGLLKDN